jgi:hypothetical protein
MKPHYEERLQAKKKIKKSPRSSRRAGFSFYVQYDLRLQFPFQVQAAIKNWAIIRLVCMYAVTCKAH